MAPGLVGQHPEKMPGIRMIGLCGQHLLVEPFRLRQPPGLVMLEREFESLLDRNGGHGRNRRLEQHTDPTRNATSSPLSPRHHALRIARFCAFLPFSREYFAPQLPRPHNMKDQGSWWGLMRG